MDILQQLIVGVILYFIMGRMVLHLYQSVRFIVVIAVDIETKENKDLKQHGDGSVKKDGQITCVSVYDGKKATSYRVDDIELKNILASNTPKIFHNGIYDLSWLTIGYDLKVNGMVRDTLTRASLIEPTVNSYTLDSCCLRANIQGKNYNDTIDSWWKDHGDGKSKAIKNMDKIPFEIQARYAEQDVKATWDLFNYQEKKIKELKLEKIEELEAKLIPVVMRMKRNGIRIDVDGLNKMEDDWKWHIFELEDSLIAEAGIVNVDSPKQIRHFFHEQGIHSPFKTPTGNESFDKDALNAIDHPVAQQIVKLRSLRTILTTFLQGGLQEHYNGRVHGSFYPTNRDEGGTITGRFSSAHPNMQNIPSRDSDDASNEYYGKALRRLFLPEDGMLLGTFDYRQIEYVLFAHFAISIQAPGWKQLQQALIDGADYHNFVLDMLRWEPKMRKIAKTLNFGVLYGMGKNKCKVTNYRLFKPPDNHTIDSYVDWVYDTYFKLLTFVRPTCEDIRRVARNRGYVISLGGRRHITERGFEYKSVNKLVQGSAADVLKMGLVEAEEAGVWDILPLHLTVHDENIFSIPRSKIGVEAVRELERCMVTSQVYKVPIRIDTEVGPNWLDASLEGYEKLLVS
jgi:DNA polymerase-1